MSQPNLTKNSIEPIILGSMPFLTNVIPEVIQQDGSSVIPAGTVLGKLNLSTSGAASIAISTAGNTGTGAVTMDATQPCQPGARAGVYAVNFTGAAAGYVTGPDGAKIGAAFTSLPNPWTKELKFVVSGTPVAGDVITITVPGIVQTNGTHTGSGVITMDGTTPVLAGAKAGLYTLTFTGAAAGYLLDPNGNQVGAAFTSLPNPWANELKFVVTGTPAAADVSYIFITAGNGKLKRWTAAAFDGSQWPLYVCNIPMDATAGDLALGISGGLISAGLLNAELLIFADGSSFESVVPYALGMRVIDLLRGMGLEPGPVAHLSDFDN